MDRVGIDHVHLLGDVAFGGQCQRLGGEAPDRAGRRPGRCAKALANVSGNAGWWPVRCAVTAAQQELERQALPRFPAIERIAVVGQQVSQLASSS